jgi:organic hydroperoxide reductase OsmC/OhrA
MKDHRYETSVTWTGNSGSGTSKYNAYTRDHEVASKGKTVILGSSDPAFRGDPSRYNPEELLVASVSQCHMLWYLHLCSVAGVIVTHYVDQAEGTMVEHDNGAGEFTNVTLNPQVTVREEIMISKADQLHAEVHQYCFIARSLNFPITHKPVTLSA